ncbi:unnamed protein product [Sympodiomycopsis kandeliae]
MTFNISQYTQTNAQSNLERDETSEADTSGIDLLLTAASAYASGSGSHPPAGSPIVDLTIGSASESESENSTASASRSAIPSASTLGSAQGSGHTIDPTLTSDFNFDSESDEEPIVDLPQETIQFRYESMVAIMEDLKHGARVQLNGKKTRINHLPVVSVDTDPIILGW